MTSKEILSTILDPIGLGTWQYYPEVGSTNDLALTWAQEDALDWSLVLADAQTKGRRRGERSWVTRQGTGLAMSLILRPHPAEAAHVTRFTALGALGLVKALSGLGLGSEIKWPNDILLGGKKVGGVLVEADWQADSLNAVVVGMGVNVAAGAVPPAEDLRYPATSVAEMLGETVDRWTLMGEILREMMGIRLNLAEPTFVEEWNAHLAFRNEWVRFSSPGGSSRRVKILGIEEDGHLTLENEDGGVEQVVAGEIVIPALRD